MLPEPRYAEWRSVPTRRWVSLWTGFGAGLLALLAEILAFGYPVFVSSGAVASYVSGLIRERQLASLRDDPEGGQFTASLTVSRALAYGYDEGLVSFEEGWLIYAGRRCGFSLPASAVEVWTVDKNSLSFSFGPEDDRRLAQISVASSNPFLEAASQWKTAEILAPQSVVYPPFVANETAVVALRSLTALTITSACVLVLLGPLLHVIHDTLPLMLSGLVLLGIVLYLLTARYHLRRLYAGLPPSLPFWCRPLRLSRQATAELPPDAQSPY